MFMVIQNTFSLHNMSYKRIFFSDLFNNVLSEIREKVVQEIEIVTGVKAEFKKFPLLPGGDFKETTNILTINKETGNRRHNQDNVMNLVTPIHTHGLAHNHILSVDMFSKEQLNEIFNLAQTLRVYVIKGRPLDNILKVNILSIVFIRCY